MTRSGNSLFAVLVSVVLIGGSHLSFGSEHISRLIRQTNKPIFAVNVNTPEKHKKVLLDYGVVSFPTPERAVRVLRLMAQYRNFLNGN